MRPNGGSESWSYDSAGRLTGTTWLSSTTLFSQTATLDAAGQRTLLADSWGSTAYGYDAAGRLTSASYPDGSSEADQYDALGNRVAITSTTTLAGSSVITNTYDLANELTTSSSLVGVIRYSYDGTGRQTGSTGITGVITNTYNDLGQLVQMQGPGTNSSYVYDGQGDRLRSYEQGTPTWTLHNDAQDLVGGLSSLVADGQADYTYLSPGTGQAPLAAYGQSTARTTYLGSDLLGSVRLATDPSGAVIGAGGYDAWGNARAYQGSSGPTLLAGLQAVPFGYAGQYADAGPGTYAMRARQYDPTPGRFISQDPQAYDPQVPVTINPYEYAGDMVTSVTDPSGRGWVQQPSGSTDDTNEGSLQANIAHEMGGPPQFGSASLTTEYNVPVYTTHCAQPPKPYNAGILSLSADHTHGYFWDIEHVQAYTRQPGAAAIANGIRTHLALPLLQGTLIDWGAQCAGERVGNPYGGAVCTSVQRIRVAGIQPGPNFIDTFQLRGPDTYPVAIGGQTVRVRAAEYNQDPWSRVVAWAVASQAGLILYDRFRLTPDCAHGDLFVQFACIYLASRLGSGTELPHPPEETGTTTAPRKTAPAEDPQAEEMLAAPDASGEATLGEDLSQARRAERSLLGCSTCFAAGTQVAGPTGSTAIERLKVGELVLAEDPKGGKVEPEAVQAVIDDGLKPLIQLDLSDRSTIRVTSNHYFWVDGGRDLAGSGWLEAGQLRPGDRLRTASGTDMMVVALHWNVGDAEVYTLTVAKDHTFFVGTARVLVHNSGCGDVNFEGTFDPAPPEVLNDVDRGNKLKGAWGQRAMDKVMAEQGYVRVGGHSADDAAAKGVDGIYRKVDPGIHPEWPEYIVGEAKFVSKEKRIDPGVQLEQWYLETRAFVREKPALVQELYEKGYGRVISRILPDGSVKVATFEGFVPPKPT